MLTTVIALFALAALAGGVMMLVLRHPMHVALALITTMIALAGIYAALDMHVIAVFQVLIYVGAVMVFMVYAIMLLDVRDRSFREPHTRLLLPGVAGFALLLGALLYGLMQGPPEPVPTTPGPFGVRDFAVVFMNDYWLYFELAAVLLLVAVVAAIAVLRARRGEHG